MKQTADQKISTTLIIHGSSMPESIETLSNEIVCQFKVFVKTNKIEKANEFDRKVGILYFWKAGNILVTQ